eukprot:475418_1
MLVLQVNTIRISSNINKQLNKIMLWCLINIDEMNLHMHTIIDNYDLFFGLQMLKNIKYYGFIIRFFINIVIYYILNGIQHFMLFASGNSNGKSNEIHITVINEKHLSSLYIFGNLLMGYDR